MTTDLAKKDASTLAPLGYAILQAEPGTLGEVLAENIGGEAISPFDLDRVKVPAGGSTTWSVPSLDGEQDAKTLDGVIIFQRTVRSFWAQRMEESGGGSPPDCSSQDGQVGIGRPKLAELEHPDLAVAGEARYSVTGEEIRAGRFACKDCPLAQFGSGLNQRSQACKMARLLFLLRPDSILPLVVSVPPSSLRTVKQYLLRLAGQGVPYYGVETSLGLTKTKNADGIQYAEIVPAPLRRLSTEDTARMRAVSQAMAPLLSAVQLQVEEDGA